MARVVIDPGHGGRDPGAVGPTGVQEKIITLVVAKQVATILAQVADVELTRSSDYALGTTISADLSARGRVANQAKADVFISIHCNAAIDRAATGTETYRYPGSTQGALLAGILQRRLVSALGLPDRGVKQAQLTVLWETDMPAALVELAFLSNPTEEGLLESPAFQEKAARAIAEGIAEYLGLELPAAKVDHWAQLDLDALFNEGIINTPRTPEQLVQWGEFAAVIKRICG